MSTQPLHPQQPLPPDASLEHLKYQAKDLLKAVKSHDPAALIRVRASLPRLAKSSDADLRQAKFTLADAQFILAREYGFESWPKLKTHVEGDPDKLFAEAINGNDAAKVKALLRKHPALKTKLNAPLFGFDSPAIVAKAGNRELVDVLLAAGADINVKSSWWAGGFGVLHGQSGDHARYLIERGARVDAHAAAHLSLVEKLTELLDADPALVNARGPDGMSPLHFAATPEIAKLLLDRGADVNFRDLDHESTPAQYAIPDRVDVCRYLLARGAEADIFMACVLGDVAQAQRLLAADPAVLQQRIGKRKFVTIKSQGEHIYAYHLGYTQTPLLLGLKHGSSDFAKLLLAHASPRELFLHACISVNEAEVSNILARDPGIAASLTPEEASAIADAAWNNQLDAVRLMLKAGFPVDARGIHNSTPLDRACIRGYIELVNLLLDHGASIDVVNAFGGTPLRACIWGSVKFRDTKGNYPAVVERLLKAGAKVPEMGGSAEVETVLKKYR